MASRPSPISEGQALRKLQSNPKRVLDSARRGNTQELVELANYWPSMGPELLNLDILGVFFTHLDGTMVPALSPSISRGGKRSSGSVSLKDTLTINRAWVSFAGLTKVGSLMMPPDPQISIENVEKTLVAGWDGAFKWCSYFYGARIAPVAVAATSARSGAADGTVSFRLRREAMDMLSAVLYSLSRSERVREAIVDTPGTVEMATRLWVLEDEGPIPSTQDIPVGSAALDGLLTVPDFRGFVGPDSDKLSTKKSKAEEEEENRLENAALARRAAIRALLDRVVSSAGGSASNVVQLTLSRLKSAINGPGIHQPHSAIYLDLMVRLSRVPDHQLRLGFLSEGVITMLSKLAVRISGMLERSVGISAKAQARARIGFGGPTNANTSAHLGLSGIDYHLLSALVASIGYLSNTLESTDGFSWVAQSLSSGLLQAWVGTAKLIHYLDPEDADMVVSVLGEVIIPYLVYRSVIIAVKAAITRVREAKAQASKSAGGKADGRKANWDAANPKVDKDGLNMDEWTPEARKAWRMFEKLALERYLVAIHMKAVKGKIVACDNVKCQKVDSKNNFMKCSSCSNTMYCSRECQVVAWKEGGHKTVCKLKQQETHEGKYQSISKADAAYFHHLSTRDARRHLPLLRRLAAESNPTLSPTELVIAIDYLKYPPKFSVHPLSEHEKFMPRIASGTSANAEARNEELINRAREYPGKYGIIQSRIANGQGVQMVLSVVTGNFWEGVGWGGPGEGDQGDGYLEEEEELTEDEKRVPGGVETLSANRKGKGRKTALGDEDEDDLRRIVDDVDRLFMRVMLNDFLKSMGESETF